MIRPTVRSIRLAPHAGNRSSRKRRTVRLISPWVDGPPRKRRPIGAARRRRLHPSRDGSTASSKINGKRVALAEVEAALAGLSADLPSGGGQVGGDSVAVALPSPQGQAELNALRGFRFGRHLWSLLSDRFEPMARPRRWRYVAELPVTSMGKRDAEALARLFDEAPDV